MLLDPSQFSFSNNQSSTRSGGCLICHTPCIFSSTGCLISARDISKLIMLFSAFGLSWNGSFSLFLLTPYVVLGFVGALITSIEGMQRSHKSGDSMVFSLIRYIIYFPFFWTFYSVGAAFNVAHTARKFMKSPRFPASDTFIAELIRYSNPFVLHPPRSS